ncbi:MAG: hypothetical protein ABI970_24795, partial [Chloroflexota bacterium]
MGAEQHGSRAGAVACSGGDALTQRRRGAADDCLERGRNAVRPKQYAGRMGDDPRQRRVFGMYHPWRCVLTRPENRAGTVLALERQSAAHRYAAPDLESGVRCDGLPHSGGLES